MSLALAEWSDGLRGFKPDELQYALDYAKNNLEWPPSIAEFRAIAKSRHGSIRDTRTPEIEGKREYVPPSSLLAEFMAKHPESHSAPAIQNAKEWLAKIRQKLSATENRPRIED